jgi:hypothetical protein
MSIKLPVPPSQPPPTPHPLAVSVAAAFTSAVKHSGIRLVAFDFDLCVLSIHSFAQRLTPPAVLQRPLAQDFTDLPLFLALAQSLQAAGVHLAIASFGRNEVIRTYLGRAFPLAGTAAAADCLQHAATSPAHSPPLGLENPAQIGTAGPIMIPTSSRNDDSTAAAAAALMGGTEQQQHLPFTICTPHTVGLLDGCSDAVNGKNVQLAYLAKHFGDLDKGSVVFFDGALGGHLLDAARMVILPPHTHLTHAHTPLPLPRPPPLAPYPPDDGKNIRLALEGGWTYATHTPKGLNVEAIKAATDTLNSSS